MVVIQRKNQRGNKKRIGLVLLLVLLLAYGALEVSFRLQGDGKTMTTTNINAQFGQIESGKEATAPFSLDPNVVDSCDDPELCVSRNATTWSCNLFPCEARCQMNNKSYHFGGDRQLYRDASVRGIVPTITGRTRDNSGCLQSDKYRFLFLHVLKSGGTTVKEFLRQALCNSTTVFCTDPSILKPVDCRPAIQAHPDYRVWGFVRNPYGRYYSGYAMALYYTKVDYEFSFEEFVLKSDLQRGQLTGLHLSHFIPQASFLLDRKGCPAMDFVGRLEHVDHDLEYFLNVLGSPELLDYFHTYCWNTEFRIQIRKVK